jgi:hypothetical protein
MIRRPIRKLSTCEHVINYPWRLSSSPRLRRAWSVVNKFICSAFPTL